MCERLVSFSVEHPQLEHLPHEVVIGRKKAQVWKNQCSPALMLGSINLYSPENTPRRSLETPMRVFSSLYSESPTFGMQYPDTNFYNAMSKFPRFTKAHPKVNITCPFVEATLPRRRMGDVGSQILMNRKSMG